jgi:hypothetical protein
MLLTEKPPDFGGFSVNDVLFPVLWDCAYA